VRSQTGSTTRNRDQASHAQNSNVSRWLLPAPIRGPAPQSNCSHRPGSGTHGRNTRRFPARQAFFASATARRVVRSEPTKPIDASFWCTTSARIAPFERSTHSSILGSSSSRLVARRRRPPGTWPASRSAT